MAILYGLAAAMGFGVADFFATKSARRVGVVRTTLAVQIFGTLAMGIVLIAKDEAPKGSVAAWAQMALLAVVSFFGVLCLYRAFAIGTLSLVSPIASGFAVVTAGLALAAGERPPGLAITGALLLVVGVVVVSRTTSEGAASIAGIPEAIGASICFGVFFWGTGELTPELGVYWPVMINRIVQLGLALGLVLIRPPEPVSYRALRPVIPPMILAALLDTSAILASNMGVDSGYITTTTALTSLYSAITVLLAWSLLRERLAAAQWAGVGVVLAGVLLVSL